MALAIHDEQIAEHGGGPGIRDLGLLQSALARPRHLAAYGDPDIAELAAAYGAGVIRNHPFVDGNKRTGLVLVELFLALNAHELAATDVECVTQIVRLAEGSVREAGFATWLRSVVRPI